MSVERKGSLKDILFFALVFFCLLTPYLTGNNIEEIMSSTINKDYSGKWNGYEWDGFQALSVLYFTLGVFCWFTPPIIAKIGPKTAIAFGGVGCSLALATFLYPIKYGLILAAFISGTSTSLLNTGQGSYLGSITSQETNTRDAGLCYAIFQLAPVLGGSMVTLLLGGKESIPEKTRLFLYSGLIAVGCFGISLTLFLKPNKSTVKSPSPIKVIKQSFQLLATKRMACLTVTCLYAGHICSFVSNLYGTSVGYTKTFGVNRKQYAGESGMLIGTGQLLAGVLLVLTRNYKKAERLVIFAYILTLITLGFIYINLPDNANRVDTDDKAIIQSSLPLALVCALLVGFCDGCFETQISRSILKHYPENTTAPFALYFSAQATAMGMMNLFSSFCGIHLHCILLAIACTTGTATFFMSLSADDGRGEDFVRELNTPSSKQNSISIDKEFKSTIESESSIDPKPVESTASGEVKITETSETTTV